MTNMYDFENSILSTKNFLLVLSNPDNADEELQYLINNFSGTVVKTVSDIPDSKEKTRIYAVGNLESINEEKRTIFVVKEFSANYKNKVSDNFQVIGLGQVPINIHGLGVFYRNFFKEKGLFKQIESEHEFQNLSLSNKSTMALRKGIYLSKVRKEKTQNEKEVLKFHLLRCSTNLTGPTENFRKTDTKIIDSLNEVIKFDFEKTTEFNHVLAQIYLNKKQTNNKHKESKATIKAHSDKTKDMSKNGLLAFCTFYDKENFEHLEPSKLDRFDRVYKEISGFTTLLFKLKSKKADDSLVKEFSVTLYPNSVFIIPLSTNRLYTHEIRSSALDIDKIPTRMGYVVRCSNLEAIYMDNQTYINEGDELIKLEQINPESRENLKTSYLKENKTMEVVNYGKVHFSMNSGDYKKPIY